MNEETEARLKEFLIRKVRPIFKQTAGKEVDLSEVVVWLEKYNSQSGFVTLGIALQGVTGCSPFCGCAGNQIAGLIERMLKKEFPFVNAVVGRPGIPPESVLTEWDN